MLEQLLKKYKFNVVGSNQDLNYYRKLNDGGIVSLSISRSGWNTPRGFFPLKEYIAVEVGFIKEGVFYNPPFIREEFSNERGVLRNYPISKMEDLFLQCGLEA